MLAICCYGSWMLHWQRSDVWIATQIQHVWRSTKVVYIEVFQLEVERNNGLTCTRCAVTSGTWRIREKRNPQAAASHFTPSGRTCCESPWRNVTSISCKNRPADTAGAERGSRHCASRRWMRCSGRHPFLDLRDNAPTFPPSVSARLIAGHGANSPPLGSVSCWRRWWNWPAIAPYALRNRRCAQDVSATHERSRRVDEQGMLMKAAELTPCLESRRFLFPCGEIYRPDFKHLGFLTGAKRRDGDIKETQLAVTCQKSGRKITHLLEHSIWRYRPTVVAFS